MNGGEESPYITYAKENKNMFFGLSAFIVIIIIIIIVMASTSSSFIDKFAGYQVLSDPSGDHQPPAFVSNMPPQGPIYPKDLMAARQQTLQENYAAQRNNETFRTKRDEAFRADRKETMRDDRRGRS